jgi:hypothetical protein
VPSATPNTVTPGASQPEHVSEPGDEQYSKKELWFLEVVSNWRTIEAKLLQQLPTKQHGWCKLVNMATNKGETGVPLPNRQGYIQLSYEGINKVRLYYGKCLTALLLYS